jgi:signal transduction histidine kinase
LSGRTLPGPQKGHLLVEAIVEDITQQRILDEHLRQADKMEALGRMATGLAHDFNNLLLGITLNLEHLMKRVGSADHRLRLELQETLQAAQNAGVITRQLLVFGRKRPLQQQPVNLNDIIVRSHSLVSHLAGENIYVNLQLAEHLGVVMADPVQLQQVLLNLAANARDAMPAGGQITLQTVNVNLEEPPSDEYFIRPPRPDRYVVLDFSDTGTGISREAISHIFEPFFTTKNEGSGLGLSASYGIASQSAGYMSVRSEPGRGTTLKLYLPRAPEASDSLKPA